MLTIVGRRAELRSLGQLDADGIARSRARFHSCEDIEFAHAWNAPLLNLRGFDVQLHEIRDDANQNHYQDDEKADHKPTSRIFFVGLFVPIHAAFRCEQVSKTVRTLVAAATRVRSNQPDEDEEEGVENHIQPAKESQKEVELTSSGMASLGAGGLSAKGTLEAHFIRTC